MAVSQGIASVNLNPRVVMVTGKPPSRLEPACGKRVRTIHERRFAVLATLTANTNLVKVISAAFRRGRKMKTVPELRALLEVDPMPRQWVY